MLYIMDIKRIAIPNSFVVKKRVKKMHPNSIASISEKLKTIDEAGESTCSMVMTEQPTEQPTEEPPSAPPSEKKAPPDYLARLNAHERDQYIIFDEGPHEYTVHGKKGYTSVTTWNHSLFSHFDEDKQIKSILKNRKWKNDPEYKYYKKTPEEIKHMWDTNRNEASQAGTKMHFDIECYYNKVDVSNNSIEFSYFMNFARDYAHLEAYRTEWCVYDEELKLSGSIDMVFRDKNTGEFYIYDWKRSRGIDYESYGDKCSHVACISHLPDCNFWHYSLQLNTYRFMLEKNYGFKIKGMYLVCLHPNNQGETYDRIEVHDLRKEIDDLMEFRSKIVAGEIEWPPAAAH